MNRAFVFLLLVLVIEVGWTQEPSAESALSSWSKSTKLRLGQIWKEGETELYLPTYAWHNRYKYSRNRIDRYNEIPWGGGFGKSLYDEKGNWHGIFAFAFLDSHKNVEPVVGYAYLKVSHLSEHFSIGGGYTLLATARPDILHNIPFPGALPWVSVRYRHASLSSTYVPGSRNVGNVLFVVFKWAI